MKLKNLTAEDWDSWIKMVSKGPQESEHTLHVRINLLNLIKEGYLSGRSSMKGYLQEMVKQTFGKPFKKIPLLMKDAAPIETAIYRFRLEKGY